MKKLFASLATLGLGGVALAEDSTSSIDLSEATTALTSIKTALVDWVGDAVPILVAIAGAFMVFWLGKMVFRLVKSWTSKAS